MQKEVQYTGIGMKSQTACFITGNFQDEEVKWWGQWEHPYRFVVETAISLFFKWRPSSAWGNCCLTELVKIKADQLMLAETAIFWIQLGYSWLVSLMGYVHICSFLQSELYNLLCKHKILFSNRLTGTLIYSTIIVLKIRIFFSLSSECQLLWAYKVSSTLCQLCWLI